MHYVIGDIHNESRKLKSILSQIKVSEKDEVFVLGDLFDRGGIKPDPVGVYFTLCGIKAKVTWIRGNHDQWLAEYIKTYYSKTLRQREKMSAYSYNSFELMRQRLTEVDLINLSEHILNLSLQKEIAVGEQKYLLAHAMTSYPDAQQGQEYYLMGNHDLDDFFVEGIEGYISICGHTPTESVLHSHDESVCLDEYKNSIWRNKKENVYLLDCGCGFESGRLACICLESGERFYSN